MARATTLRWSQDLSCSPDAAWTTFLDALWLGGAGFGPSPVVVDRGDPNGIGCTRRIGLGFGSALIERIDEGVRPDWLVYRVVNPGWRTFPVRRHRGEVRFATTTDGTRVDWSVEMVPLPGAGLVVRLLTRAVVGRYVARLRLGCSDVETDVRAGD